LKEKREEKLKDEQKQKKAIKESISKGRSRPMLVESYNCSRKGVQTAKVASIREFLKILEGSGLSKQDALSRLTNDERTLLDEENFIEAAKQKFEKEKAAKRK